MITFDSSGGLVTIKDGFNVIRVLSENSKNISWGYGSDTSRISFTIDDVTFDNVLTTQIAFSGTPLSSATGFKAAVEGLFPNLAGGGSSYLVYAALLNQSGSNEPVPTVKENGYPGTFDNQSHQVGVYSFTLDTPVHKNRVAIPGFNSWVGSNCITQTLWDGAVVSGYIVMYASITGDNVTAINIETYNAVPALAEMGTLISNLFFEFRVYNE